MYHKWQSYDVLFLSYGAWGTQFFCHFGPFFALLPPRNQNFEKIKTTTGDITILHMCTINDNHMMYGSWDIEHDRQNLLSSWTIFCSFTTQKIKIWKTEENSGDIIISHKCTKNHDHMLYCSWDMVHDRCNCYFSFWAIFLPFYPLTAQKIKILKKWQKKKTPGDIIILHMCSKKLWSDDIWLSRYGAWCMDGWMDGQTDGWKKWHIEVGAPPKKLD